VESHPQVIARLGRTRAGAAFLNIRQYTRPDYCLYHRNRGGNFSPLLASISVFSP